MDHAIDKTAQKLERLIREETAAHDALAKLLDAKLEALRAGQRERIEQLCEQENRCLQGMAELAKHRMRVMAEFVDLLQPGLAGAPAGGGGGGTGAAGVRTGVSGKVRMVDSAASRSPQAGAMRLRELAESAPEPWRGRLSGLRDELKERMEAVSQRSQKARRVVETMVRHMHGMMQEIGSRLSGVSTYGSKGSRPASATALSTFSTTA